MCWTLKTIAKFAFVLIAMTILCTFVWELLAAQLYDCTDENLLGYWTPGNWVHGWDGLPVATVQEVAHRRSMSEPDTIKAGWSVTGLWCLWCSFVAISVVVSMLLARKRWIPAKLTQGIKSNP